MNGEAGEKKKDKKRKGEENQVVANGEKAGKGPSTDMDFIVGTIKERTKEDEPYKAKASGKKAVEDKGEKKKEKKRKLEHREGSTPVEKAKKLLAKEGLMSKGELLGAVSALEQEYKKNRSR